MVIVCATVGVGAQSVDPADPIRCWWRTSVGAVAVGEPFDASLTCAARERDAIRTVPDETRLAAAAMQLTPFEILRGSHPADLRTATHRFFQYHYSLRIIDRDAIGRDARFPAILIAYRVHTRVNGEWVPGRDRTYVVPGQSMRVLSLVPVEADDIRDSGRANFGDAAGLRFRSRALEIAAVALVLLGVIIALPAFVTLVRRRPAVIASGERTMARRVVLSAARNELAVVAHEGRGGWTPDLAARALNALRLIAACALQRDVAHQAIAGSAPLAGRLVASHGMLRRQQVALSSAVTPVDLQTGIAALPLTAPHQQRRLLEELLDSMRGLTDALYGASFDAQSAALDHSVTAARAAADRLKAT